MKISIVDLIGCGKTMKMKRGFLKSFEDANTNMRLNIMFWNPFYLIKSGTQLDTRKKLLSSTQKAAHNAQLIGVGNYNARPTFE